MWTRIYNGFDGNHEEIHMGLTLLFTKNKNRFYYNMFMIKINIIFFWIMLSGYLYFIFKNRCSPKIEIKHGTCRTILSKMYLFLGTNLFTSISD